MEAVPREVAMKVVKRNADKVRSGKSNWSRIAELFVLFMDEYQDLETTKIFVKWISFSAPRLLNEDADWTPFFKVSSRRGKLIDFVFNWMDKKDIPLFMEFVKKQDEKLWRFITNPKISCSLYYWSSFKRLPCNFNCYVKFFLARKNYTKRSYSFDNQPKYVVCDIVREIYFSK